MKKIIYLILLIFFIYTSIMIYNLIGTYQVDKKCSNKSIEIINKKNLYSTRGIEEEKGIPKKILQTYKTIDKVPPLIIKNIKTDNPDWEYIFFDDEKCKKFLLENYGQKYLDKFNSFKKGCHKSDLFRLCWLYLNGGVYLDIDVELLKPLNQITKNINSFTMPYTNEYLSNRPLNAFMVSNKGNPVIKECIENIMKVKKEDLYDKYMLILYIMKYTMKDKIEYEFSEKHINSFNPYSKYRIFDKEKKIIANPKYEFYKDGKFKNNNIGDNVISN